jgi:hypothetical protein
MNERKKATTNLIHLYHENEFEIKDRKLVEDLKNRLHKLISNDLGAQKKAAQILSQWLNKNHKK